MDGGRMHVDRSIILDFSAGEPAAKATVGSLSYESHVNHLDILIFKVDGSLYWHERVSVASSSGTYTLPVGTGYFAQKNAYGQVISHPRYNVHILANCPNDMAYSISIKLLLTFIFFVKLAISKLIPLLFL